MKIFILLNILILVSFSFTNIPLKKIQKTETEELIRKLSFNYLDKGIQFLLKQFVPQSRIFTDDVKSWPEIKMSNHGGFQYSGPLEVGTPGQQFDVLYDTGSSDLWLPAEECDTIGCQNFSKFDASKSTTNENLGGKFKILYGAGPVGGYYSKDVINWGGKVVKNVTFGEATYINGIGNLFRQFDGVFGLGFPGLSKVTPPFQIAQKQGVFQDNSFAIYLQARENSHGSVLVLGGVDPKFAASDFRYYNVSLQLWWTLPFNNIKVGSHNIKLTSAIVDSGSSVFFASPIVNKEIRQAIGFSQNSQLVVCSQINLYPTIYFEINGDSFAVESNVYIHKNTQNGQTQCQIGFVPTDLGEKLGDRSIILGDLFMQKYYTHFDFGSNGNQPRVGFALAKDPSQIQL